MANELLPIDDPNLSEPFSPGGLSKILDRIEADARAARLRAEAVERYRRDAHERAERERADESRRAADLEHRKRINRKALADLREIDLGGWNLEEGQARLIFAAIVAGRVAHVGVKY